MKKMMCAGSYYQIDDGFRQQGEKKECPFCGKEVMAMGHFRNGQLTVLARHSRS
jgi:ribosomal protein S27AE